MHFSEIRFYRLPLPNELIIILIILNFHLRPLENDKCGIYDLLGVRLFNRLRLGFSHLREYKFRHNFVDTLTLLCSSSLEIEDTDYCFLRC